MCEGGSLEHVYVVISKSEKYQFRTLFVLFYKTLVCGIWVVYAYTVTYEDVFCSSADREEENTEGDQIECEDNEESVFFSPANREEENTEDDQIEYEASEESVSFSYADREEENTGEITEENQIEYENNEESVLQEMEDDIQALDSQEKIVGLLHEDIHQELVLKEMEIGELQLENNVLAHKVSKLKEKNQSLLMQLVQSQPIVHSQHVLSFTQIQAVTDKFSIHMIKDNDGKILFYTGLPSYMGCIVFWNHLSQASQKSYCLIADGFLLCLMKLHLGTQNVKISNPLQHHQYLCKQNLSKWIDMMSVELKSLVCWSDHEVLHANMSSCFQKHFSKVVWIIDSFEVFICILLLLKHEQLLTATIRSITQ